MTEARTHSDVKASYTFTHWMSSMLSYSVTNASDCMCTAEYRDDTMSDENTEDELVENYVKWAKQNAIPVSECSAEDIEEYMLRRFKAAG